jgi:hypothetical protein
MSNLPKTRQYIVIEASKPMGMQQETLSVPNCSSMEIYISEINDNKSCKLYHQNQVQDIGNKASNE